MNARSAINKGNRFENYLIDVLKEKLDAKAQRTYGSGNGLDKNDIRLVSFDIEIEAKNAMQINLIKDWSQCKRQTMGANTGVLMIRNPKEPEFKETLVVMDLHDWIDLVRHQKNEIQIQSDFSPDMKWKIKRLVEAGKAVFKGLENL
jgi:hypothetical protein